MTDMCGWCGGQAQWLDFAAAEGAILDRRRWLATLTRAIHACDDGAHAAVADASAPPAGAELRAQLQTLLPLDGAPTHSAAALRARVTRALPGRRLRGPAAEAMCVALRAAVAGWRGLKHELIAMLSAAGGRIESGALMHALVARHELTHPTLPLLAAEPQKSQKAAAKHARTQRAATCKQATEAVAQWTQAVDSAHDSMVTYAPGCALSPPRISGCEWCLAPGPPPPTTADADVADHRRDGLWHALQQSTERRVRGGKRPHGAAGTVIEARPGPPPKRRKSKGWESARVCKLGRI
jgi:hypothetical protein